MIKLSIILILQLFLIQSSFGQIPLIASRDTNKTQVEPIAIAAIPMSSTELRIKMRQEMKELISDEAILKLQTKVGQFLNSVDKELINIIETTDSKKNIHFLESRKFELQNEQKKVQEQKVLLTETIEAIDVIKIKLDSESQRWNLTLEQVKSDTLNLEIPGNLHEAIGLLDSIRTHVNRKSTSLTSVLYKTITTSLEIDKQIERITRLIITKQKNAFEQDHTPFFSLNFNISYLNELRKSFSYFALIEIIELRDYLWTHQTPFLLVFLLFFVLIYLFRFIKQRVSVEENKFGFFYKDLLLKMLAHPVSSSIILCLFSALFLFPDRPPIFKELSFYIIAFPVIRILSILIEKKYHNYIFAFGVLVMLYIFMMIFPSDSLSHRILQLIISVFEFVLFISFLKRFNKRRESNEKQIRIIHFFVILHLVLAFIGFLSNLSGHLVLTEIMISAVFFNTFNGLSLLITILIIDGLITTGIDSNQGQKLHVLQIYGELIKKQTVYWLNLFAILYWLVLILKNFRMLDLVYGAISNVLTHRIKIGSAEFSLDGFVIFFIIMYLFILISKIIRIVLEEDVLNRFTLSKGLPHTIAMMVRYTLITAGFFLAVNAGGIPMDKLTIIIGAMSVGIGFGLQNIFNNLVSGLILLFERPIQLGDTVQVGQLTGNVQSIGLRSSNIKTFDGAEVIVPNGQLVSNEVINWTLSDQQRRIEIAVGVSYNSEPQLVQKLLKEILTSHPEILNPPSPLVFFSALGESSLDFVLLFWIADYNEGRRIKSEILTSVFTVLRENNIEIPYPQRDLHVRSVDGEFVIRNTIPPDAKP